jgi:uncharacterized coiled-coil protein SlyX
MKGNQIMKNRNVMFTTLLLAYFGFLSGGLAVVPAPDGGYPGGNTAEGQNALFSLTSGGFNTAVGFLSLRSDATNSFNTAIGAGTLLANTADENTAIGAGALLSNSTGPGNTANGAFALFSNTIGNGNTASGDRALFGNTEGNSNTAVGTGALPGNTTGSFNTAVGQGAGIGVTTASNVICIGAGAQNVSNTCFIGNIRGVTTFNNNAIPVLVDSVGQLGTVSSSRRFKKEIKSMDKTSESILALKPVTFHYKSDHTNRPEFGLIAEEVAEVNPNLVVRDESGEIYTVRYDAVNAMLLNEFLKEHRKVQEQEARIRQLESTLSKQEATIAQQQNGMEAVTARLNDQAAQIHKVSAQIEVRKAVDQMALHKP